MCLGIPCQVVEVGTELERTGVVSVGGVRREVNMSCVIPEDGNMESLVGSWVLVHVGFAMSVIDEEEARETLNVLQQMGEAQAELDAMREGDESVGRTEST